MANSNETIFDPKGENEPVFIDPALLQQAEQRCRQRLVTDPENATVLRSLAEVCRKQGNLAEAASIYGRLFAANPADEDAGYLHAVLGGADTPISPTGLRPAPFVLLKNFLPKDFHDSLIPFATSQRDKFVSSRVGRHAEYKPDVRQTLEFNEKWEHGERFAGYLMRILNLLPRLKIAPFPAEISAIRVRAYEDGHFFRAHIDAEPGGPSANRVYNFVYYFHRTPRAYTGGELLAFDSDPDVLTFTRARFTRVVPEDNSIILFPCNFFHSVLPVHCPSREFADSRFVINGHVSRREPAAPDA